MDNHVPEDSCCHFKATRFLLVVSKLVHEHSQFTFSNFDTFVAVSAARSHLDTVVILLRHVSKFCQLSIFGRQLLRRPRQILHHHHSRLPNRRQVSRVHVSTSKIFRARN